MLPGYALFSPRVGGGNSPYTSTPDAVVIDQVAFDAAYPTDESEPRNDYLVFPLTQGDLYQATFGWVRNDSPLNRFDYDGKADQFLPLKGGKRLSLGTLAPTSNTTRMQVRPIPVSSNPQPIRIARASGPSFTPVYVATDGDFGSPVSGTVEVSLESGRLNYNATDLSTYAGEEVTFQGQRYTGDIGAIGAYGMDSMYLNPLPASGQYPLVRVEEGVWLEAIEVPDDSFFTVPAQGTFQWSAATGKLNVPSDIDFFTLDVFYDGLLQGQGLTVPSASLGTVLIGRGTTVNAPISLLRTGADLWVRIGSDQLPTLTLVDAFDGSAGLAGVVEVERATGVVRLSTSDAAKYVGQGITFYCGDLPIERGLALRLFRSPVNLAGGGKDVTTTYLAEEAVIASPLPASPSFNLPQRAIEDRFYDNPEWEAIAGTSEGRLEVSVRQNLGSFTGALKRLDPPVALPDVPAQGFILQDQDFSLAERKLNQIVTPTSKVGSIQLPDANLTSQPILEVETSPGSGTYQPLSDYLLEPYSGTITPTVYPGKVQASSTSGQVSGNILTDTSQDFLAAGVVSGDVVVIGTEVLTVAGVNATQLTLDAPPTSPGPVSYEVRIKGEVARKWVWRDVSTLDPSFKLERILPLGVVQNSPFITVDPTKAARLRFRIGGSETSLVTIKPDDAALTPGALLPSLAVEVSEATGHCRFSALDLGAALASIVELTPSEYRVSPDLGFIQVFRPFLAYEEGRVTYKSVDNGLVVTEPVAFLVRKEKQTVGVPNTVTVGFNPTGRTLAPLPFPVTYRGSRPQVENVTVLTNLAQSQVKFLPSTQINTYFPAGPLDVGENVYVTYYVAQAFGGETTFTVSEGVMATTPVTLTQGETTFQVPGDQTLSLTPFRILRVAGEDLYIVVGSSFNGTVTTVTVAMPLRQTLNSPSLEVTSALVLFQPDAGDYEPLPRGGQVLRLLGDRVQAYSPGTLVNFGFDVYQVDGVNLVDGVTEVTLGWPASQEYRDIQLFKSPYPVAVDGSDASTQYPPVSVPLEVIYRKRPGQVGVVEGSVQVDPSGAMASVPLLQDGEELVIAYQGYGSLLPGQSIRASYSFKKVPTDQNGYKGQDLVATYTTFSPDSFYFRVEPLTTVKLEAAKRQQAAAQAAIPSSGPRLSNQSGLTLADRGRASVFYQESLYRNDDLAFRAYLLELNDVINFLESARRDATGVSVGGKDGPFRFDGLLTNPPVATVAQASNQIDDIYRISPSPYLITGPPFVATPQFTRAPAYAFGPQSRFFKTFRRPYGVAASGNVILDMGVKSVTQVSEVHERQAWARATLPGAPGDTTLTVDNALGSTDLVRPPFDVGQEVDILRPDGSLVAGGPYEVSAVGATTLALTGPLTDSFPVGSTILRVASEISYYQVGKDVGLDPDQGWLTFIPPFPPLDGSIPAIPSELEVQTPPAGQPLSVALYRNISEVAPGKPPVLEGRDIDDDGDISFPLTSPSADCEENAFAVGRKPTFLTQVAAVQAITTPTERFTADLTALNVITRQSGTFPITPLPGQLVRILTGTHGGTAFVRVLSATPTALTVDTPYPSLSTGFDALVGVSSFPVAGAGNIIGAGTTLEHVGGLFITNGVVPGYTVVDTVTQERRQVVAVPDEDHLTLDLPALPLGPIAYRVENAVLAFSALTPLDQAIDGYKEVVSTNDLPAVPSEVRAIERALDGVLTDKAANPTPVTVALPFTITGPLWSGVQPGDVCFFRGGTNRGVYTVVSVVGNTITVGEPLVLGGADQVRVASLSTLSLSGLRELTGLLFEVDDLASTLESIQISLATFPAPGYANTVDSDALAALVAQVTARNPATWEEALYSFLRGAERLYDRRYAWIDGRLNRQTGTLPLIAQAQSKRIQDQENLKNQLIRLLVLSGG